MSNYATYRVDLPDIPEVRAMFKDITITNLGAVIITTTGPAIVRDISTGDHRLLFGSFGISNGQLAITFEKMR